MSYVDIENYGKYTHDIEIVTGKHDTKNKWNRFQWQT